MEIRVQSVPAVFTCVTRTSPFKTISPTSVDFGLQGERGNENINVCVIK